MKGNNLIWASAVFAAFTAVAAVNTYNERSTSIKAQGFSANISLEDKSDVTIDYSPEKKESKISGNTSFDNTYVKGVRFNFLSNYGKKEQNISFDFKFSIFNRDFSWKPFVDLNSRIIYTDGFYKV